jgi:beta-phosphoglucomutase-like phosphatase (HAD superfamily)
MTFGQSPLAALDRIIRQAQYLLISFDGPIRSMDRGNPAHSTDAAAPPAPHIYDVLTACRESGRSVAVISTTPVAEVHAYLAAHDLSSQITIVAASIGEAASAIETSPTDCAAITSSQADIRAARIAGTPAIGFARTPQDADHLVEAGAVALVYSMADIALRLRARATDWNN